MNPLQDRETYVKTQETDDFDDEDDDLPDLIEGEPTPVHGILRRRKSLPDASEKRKSNGEEEFNSFCGMKITPELNWKNTCTEKTALPMRRLLNRAASSSRVQYAMLRSAITDDSYLQLQTLLRRRDVRVNEIEGDGLAAIHFAAMYGNCKSIEILINEGAKINFPSKDGEYPLDIAVKNGNFEIAQFLIEKGARLDNVINGTPIKSEHEQRMSRMKPRSKTIDIASIELHS